MVKILTNVMESSETIFSSFECFKAELTIEERKAWKERHTYDQPMMPTQNTLFFVSEKQEIHFIEKETIERAILNSNLKQDYHILSHLAHQALRIALKEENLFRWKNFYSDEAHLVNVKGNYGRYFDVFKGIIPRVFFENGSCIIAFDPVSKVFSRVINPIKASLDQTGFCMCSSCEEKSTCAHGRNRVSKIHEIRRERVAMVDIEGNRFDCPLSQVLIETKQRPTGGEYSQILAQTVVSPFEEHKYVHEIVDSIADSHLVLNLGKNVSFSWLELR